jgi:hypothetical protein
MMDGENSSQEQANSSSLNSNEVNAMSLVHHDAHLIGCLPLAATIRQ